MSVFMFVCVCCESETEKEKQNCEETHDIGDDRRKSIVEIWRWNQTRK